MCKWPACSATLTRSWVRDTEGEGIGNDNNSVYHACTNVWDTLRYDFACENSNLQIAANSFFWFFSSCVSLQKLKKTQRGSKYGIS